MASSPLRLLAQALGDRATADAPLGALTTYRVGGSAALLIEARHEADLGAIREALSQAGREIPVLVVGKGSNLLVADAGFRGLAVLLSETFAEILEVGGEVVRAGGAVSLPVLARRTAAMGLTGLEWAVGVPGSVGGAVRMNAGGHGSDVAACLSRCWVVDLEGEGDGGEPVAMTAAELRFGYRRSAITPAQVVTSADFQLMPGDQAASEAEIADIVRWRREHQPGGQNAGSVFTNPAGDSAGRLIDAAGLKGHRVGTAEVSTKHANFIQADPGGSADDVLALIHDVQARVEHDLGVRLEPEVRLVGFDGPGGPARPGGAD